MKTLTTSLLALFVLTGPAIGKKQLPPTRGPITGIVASILGLFLLAPPATATDPLPPTRGEVINIVEWDGGELPQVYERSEQLPFTQTDVTRLVASGFETEQIAQMIAERRYVGDASANGLITLKNNGVAPEIIQAVSKHALPPNREMNFTIHLEFEGKSWSARKRYLYIIVPDGTIDRVFTADLSTVLSGHWHNDTLIDNTDPLLPRKIRRVTFSGTLPVKTYGQKEVRIFTSTNPSIRRVEDIPQSDHSEIKTFTINYPNSSLRQDCRITIRHKQDAILADKWQLIDTHLECEWE